MADFAIVTNSKARNAEKILPYLQCFEKQGLDFELFQVEPEKLEQTLKESSERYSTILVAGGDGTVRTAAQVCANSSCALGVMPLGTLNHFAKELALPFSPEDLAESITKQSTTKIDLGEVNGLVFVNNSSIGFYPKFAQKRDDFARFYNKWLSYIPSFFHTMQHHKAYKVTLKNSNINLTLKTSFLMISNNLYTHTFPISFERKSFQKALLGVYLYKRGRLSFIKVIRSLFKSTNDFVIEQTATPLKVTVHEKQEITVSLDGETMQIQNPLVYKSLPQALTVLIKS